MRIAFLSDIHGNALALEAVLADIDSCGGADEYWLLGDLAALGYAPGPSLDRLRALPNVRALRGNTDRYATTGDRPPPTFEQVLQRPGLLPTFIEVANSFAWTRGAVTASGHFEWLSALPLHIRTTLPNGTRLLAVHGSPSADDDFGLRDDRGAVYLTEQVAGCDADLVLGGHTHRQLDCRVGAIRVVNLGSVSNPVTEDHRAGYALLEADARGYKVELRRVAYDYYKALMLMEASHHPAFEFLAHHWRRAG